MATDDEQPQILGTVTSILGREAFTEEIIRYCGQNREDYDLEGLVDAIEANVQERLSALKLWLIGDAVVGYAQQLSYGIDEVRSALLISDEDLIRLAQQHDHAPPSAETMANEPIHEITTGARYTRAVLTPSGHQVVYDHVHGRHTKRHRLRALTPEQRLLDAAVLEPAGTQQWVMRSATSDQHQAQATLQIKPALAAQQIRRWSHLDPHLASEEIARVLHVGKRAD